MGLLVTPNDLDLEFKLSVYRDGICVLEYYGHVSGFWHAVEVLSQTKKKFPSLVVQMLYRGREISL